MIFQSSSHLVNVFCFIIVIAIFSGCKNNKNGLNAIESTEHLSKKEQNIFSKNSVVDSKQYEVTKNCQDNTYIINLDLNDRSIALQKNDQQFKLPAAKLIEDVLDNEMVSEFKMVCNCAKDTNGISINYEFDLVYYKYRSLRHNLVFMDQSVFIKKAFHLYSDRQEERLFGKVFKGNTFYSYDTLVDFESDTTQIISFRNFQDENYEQHIDSYLSIVKDSYNKEDFDKLKLIADTTALSIALYNVEIKKALVQYNDIGYYLEQSKAYDEAIFLLEKIIKEFPDRTVAYVNLGDAYWGLGEKEKAKQAYKTYIQQMKANGKMSKIPKNVLDKLNQI